MTRYNYYSANFTPIYNITLKLIIKKISEILELPEEAILSSNRKKELAYARHMYCYIAKNHTNKSLHAIARFIYEGRNHSTVIHSITTFNDLIETNHYNEKEDYYRVIGELGIC